MVGYSYFNAFWSPVPQSDMAIIVESCWKSCSEQHGKVSPFWRSGGNGRLEMCGSQKTKKLSKVDKIVQGQCGNSIKLDVSCLTRCCIIGQTKELPLFGFPKLL